MKIIYLDTVGLLALWDTADQWHVAAQAAFNKIVAERAAFTTTSFVLLECGNAAARRPYRAQVDQLRQRLATRGEIVIPTDGDWDSAWTNYVRGKSDDAGIVDHVSFLVMRRLGISDVFSNDRHFRAAGFHSLF